MGRYLVTAVFLCCFLFATALSQVSSEDLCYEKVDILFIMDSSGSVGLPDFKKQLEFASTFIDYFHIGLAQFSVLRFDSYPSIIFDFDDYLDRTTLKNAILNIPYPGGSTNTAAALKLAREQAFNTSQGARPGVPKIAIVSTDGMSNSRTETTFEAKNLKDSNVLVLTIGVGTSYNKQELDAIATYPEDISEVIDYNELLSIVHDYTELVCDEVKLFDCHNDADVFFLLDSSNKINDNSFQNERNFVKSIIGKFKLNEFSFGAATFGGSVQKIFGLGELTDQSRIDQALSAAPAVLGSTDIDSALRYVRDQNVFEHSAGGRPNATKILVILTDGGSISHNQAKLTAAQLRLTGIHIIAVGVSNANISDLQDLVDHFTLDVVTNLANPSVAVSRIEILTALTQCKVPPHAVNDITDACRIYNWENGIHPHPYDCTKFIECTFLKTDIMSCPTDLVYDPEIQTCNYIGLVQGCNGGVITGSPTQRPVTSARPPVTSARPPVTSARPPATTSSAPKPCVKGKLDILFIFDSSDDVGLTGFSEELRLADNLAEYFLLGPSKVQFAGITFGTSSHNLFNFNAFTEYKTLQAAILNATYVGGITNTHLALENGLNIFDASHGSRPGSPKIAIVFTNGRSNNSEQTRQKAAILKQAGVYVIAVATANPNFPELELIATDKSTVFYENFEGILRTILAYDNKTCFEDVTCKEVKLADIIFVLDSSSSISDADYTTQLQFVADVTDNFLLGPQDVRFGSVIFSQDTIKLFDLKDFTSHAALRSAILSATHLRSGTDTAKALNFVFDEDMFGTYAGGRTNATKILIILTDGRSNSPNDTLKAAGRLKLKAVKFISIGIGSEIYLEELRQLASDNQSLFTVPGYEALHEIQESVTQKTCNDIPTKEPVTVPTKEPVTVPNYSHLCQLFGWADGRHPNPYDCSTYVDCHSLITTIFNCLSGTAYDPILQRCTDKSAAHRCDDPAYFGPTVTSATRLPSTTRRQGVINISDVCNDYKLADGIYPDPGSCKHFVECTALRTDHMECPEGLHFNTANLVCDDVHAVDCQVNYDYFNDITSG